MPEISELIADLSAEETSKRVAAAEQLQNHAAARGAAVPLVRATGDSDEQVREFATSALEELGPPNEADLGALTSLLGDPSADVAYWAATLLGRLEAIAAPSVEPLAVAMTTSQHANVRQRCAWALYQLGPAASKAKPQLEEAAAGNDRRLARMAAKALEQI